MSLHQKEVIHLIINKNIEDVHEKLDFLRILQEHLPAIYYK